MTALITGYSFPLTSPVLQRGHASKVACHPELLCPYPGVDFVTGLPPSEGHTTILTDDDRFSKAAHFVPLANLPSALQTFLLLVTHTFQSHNIPQDIVSDLDTQFASKVWKAFCQPLL